MQPSAIFRVTPQLQLGYHQLLTRARFDTVRGRAWRILSGAGPGHTWRTQPPPWQRQAVIASVDMLISRELGMENGRFTECVHQCRPWEYHES